MCDDTAFDGTLDPCNTGVTYASIDTTCTPDQAPLSGTNNQTGIDNAEDECVARIKANALKLQECSKPSQAGAWKGCCKSPWCDREDRHRGLCNHKATIPGPAALTPQAEATSSDVDEEVCWEDPIQGSVQQHAEELSSGGHSCNNRLQEPVLADELHVASMHRAGLDIQQQDSAEALGLEGDSLLPLLQLHKADMQQQPLSGLLWADGDSCQLMEEEGLLFSMPSMYQAHTKTLYQAYSEELPSSRVRSALVKQELCAMDTGLQATTQHGDQFGGPTMQGEDASSPSWQTCMRSAVKPDFSAPSSPSCASGAAAYAGSDYSAAVSEGALSAHIGAATAAVQAYAAMEEADTATAAYVRAAEHADALEPVMQAGMFALGEVQALYSLHIANSNLHAPAAAAAAMPAIASAVVPVSSKVPAHAAANNWRAAVNSTGSQNISAALAAAGAAGSSASLGAFPALQQVASGMVKLCHITPAAATTGYAAAAPAVGDAAAATPGQQAQGVADEVPNAGPAPALAVTRASRVKSKPRRICDEPEEALHEATCCSPTKGKKRMPARLAPNPTSGHSCTHCGAVSTPVWRAGPAGPKTLCNACGVRFMKVAKRK
eukprot:GHRR01007524.1.p1 GENE.GHRR01007524.1~~GHRR01007524.1.p1  ORF type:complete len:606 (+),score=251.62 GHRR01007524.1:760-2577(+)